MAALPGVAFVELAGASALLDVGGATPPSPAPAVSQAASAAPAVSSPVVCHSAPQAAPAVAVPLLPGPDAPVLANEVWSLPGVPMGTRAATEGALDNLPALTTEIRQHLIQETEAGRLRWVRFVAWDNADEDGDVIDVHAQGVALRVELLHRR